MLKVKIVFMFLVASFIGLSSLHAEEGQPIAIRHWPGGGFTIETMWDLHIGTGLTDEAKKLLPRQVDLESKSVEGTGSATLHRLPNQSKVEAVVESDAVFDDPDSEFGKMDDEIVHQTDGNKVVLSGLLGAGSFQLEADGLYVAFFNRSDVSQLEALLEQLSAELSWPKQRGGLEDWHTCIVASNEKFTAEVLSKIASVVKPEVIIVNASLKSVGDVAVENIEHNTFAFSSSRKRKEETRFVSLSTTPYEMSDEVADLFAKKEAAQKDSREMFAKLSVEQMNFKPANGSHTPRWNAEHMMGRELGFFSEIYHAVDPSIPVMNLNPKQMPKDYQFAHADWTGEEEARQMKRVENFTRRFAYLLDGMDLDKKAKGSRFWTPRKLLMQMERHYKEHSANVVKKMELEGWPNK